MADLSTGRDVRKLGKLALHLNVFPALNVEWPSSWTTVPFYPSLISIPTITIKARVVVDVLHIGLRTIDRGVVYYSDSKTHKKDIGKL
jgi:hypothetical protein